MGGLGELSGALRSRNEHSQGIPEGPKGTPMDSPGAPGSLQKLFKGAPSDSKALHGLRKHEKGSRKYGKMI